MEFQPPPLPGGGGKRGKRVSKSEVGAERADREKGVKSTKVGGGGGGGGIQITMIRVQHVGLYVERVGNLRHVH